LINYIDINVNDIADVISKDKEVILIPYLSRNLN